MRQVFDLADVNDTRSVLPPGQSGQVFSSHYKDQWPAWYYARSFPMQYRHVEVKSTLEFVAK